MENKIIKFNNTKILKIKKNIHIYIIQQHQYGTQLSVFWATKKKNVTEIKLLLQLYKKLLMHNISLKK